MRKVGIAAFSLTSAVFAGAVLLAGQATAAQTWEMPDVKGMNLEQAESVILDMTGETKVAMRSFNTTGATQEQLNPTNWIVCYQYPLAGNELTDKTGIAFGVRRPNEDCWS